MTTDGWHVASITAPTVTIPMRNELRGAWQVQQHSWRPCIEWCETQFGTMTWPGPRAVWRYVGEGVFEFERAEDRLLFLLRWS